MSFETLLAHLRAAHEAELQALRARLAQSASSAEGVARSEEKEAGMPAASPAQKPSGMPAENNTTIVDGSMRSDALPAASTSDSGRNSGESAAIAVAKKPSEGDYKASKTMPVGQMHSDGRRGAAALGGLLGPGGAVADASEELNAMARLARSKKLEIFFCCVIVLHSLIMAAEAQWDGGILGQEVGVYEGPPDPRREGETWFYAFSWIFGLLYLAELSIKLIGLGAEWRNDPWNWLDLLLVILWIYEVIEEGSGYNNGGAFNFQMVRLVRLARLVRLVKLVRTIGVFDDLYLITTALKGSARVLAWTIVVFAVIQVTLAIALTQTLNFFIDNPAHSLQKRQEIFIYFGTFGRSILTSFEITLGNWVPPCRLLVENVSEWFMLFSILHKLTAGFALVGVINGVFIQETFKVVSSDDTIMVRRKKQAAELHEKKMEALFKSAQEDRLNESGEAYITKDGYDLIMGDPDVKTWLDSMELDTRDLNRLFTLLDTGGDFSDGTITKDELISGVAALKGTAKSIDLIDLSRTMDLLAVHVAKIVESIDVLTRDTRDFTL